MVLSFFHAFTKVLCVIPYQCQNSSHDRLCDVSQIYERKTSSNRYHTNNPSDPNEQLAHVRVPTVWSCKFSSTNYSNTLHCSPNNGCIHLPAGVENMSVSQKFDLSDALVHVFSMYPCVCRTYHKGSTGNLWHESSCVNRTHLPR